MMKKWILLLACLACCNAWAADAAKSTDSPTADKTAAKQEPEKKEVPSKKPVSKKKSSKMENTGDSVKSGWNKFTHDVKQGAKKPACTAAQRSMNQCK
jgi:LAS superfamily LD-carboxypeptidase LdcB